MSTIQERAAEFLEYLKEHQEDRGMMANLRRGFNPDTADRAWPYLAHWPGFMKERDRVIYATVAAAFATHPDTTNRANLGDALRDIATDKEKGDEALRSFESRFRRLLTCETAQEVCERVGGVIRAAAQRGIPVNYVELFTDLFYWGDRVKVRWAAAYWGAREQSEDTEVAAKEAE